MVVNSLPTRGIMRTVFLIMALCSAAVLVNGCAHACKKFDEKSIPGCDLKGDGCKCVFHGKYQVSLTDPTTGVSGSSSWTSKGNAGNEAVFNLFEKDRGCNCHGSTSIPIGKCVISGKACFYFASAAAVGAKQTSYQLYANEVSPKASAVFTANAASSANIQAAAEGLLAQIVAADPTCAPTLQESEHFFAAIRH